MAVKFDLLGDPVPENHGKAGRNGHVPTKEMSNKIKVLLVSGMKLEEIARQVGISVPTIRKHYFANGKVKATMARSLALSEARARNLLRLEEAAAAGNVSAMGKLEAVLARYERELADEGWISDQSSKKSKPKKAEKPIGKKDLDRQSAMEAEAELDDLLAGDLGAGGRMN